jgi:predicted aspartyl protease
VETFKTKLKIWNPAQPSRQIEVEVWVDTGSAFSWISRARLEELGLKAHRRVQCKTIEGNVLEREMASVFVGIDGYSGPDLVVMAQPGDSEVMGAHSIEGLALAADPVQKKLIPTVMLALHAS